MKPNALMRFGTSPPRSNGFHLPILPTVCCRVVQITTFNKIYFGGQVGSAIACIRYGTENGVRHTRITRPFIITDGIDFSPLPVKDVSLATSNPNYESNTIRYGFSGWDILTTGIDEDELETGDRENFHDYPILFDDLLGKGYDIIFLDFQRGSDYIQKNSFLLETLLNRVNAEKCGNSSYGNILLGPSMGGQIARYTLARMEREGKIHDVDTYVSFDSPHQGANIPLNIQSAAFMLHQYALTEEGQKDAESHRGLWRVLNTPAARQQILNSLGEYVQTNKVNINEFRDDARPSSSERDMRADILPAGADYTLVRAHYVQEMDNLGYPKKSRNIALGCGSFTGANQGYNAGDLLVNSDLIVAPTTMQRMFFSNLRSVLKLDAYAAGGNNTTSDLTANSVGYWRNNDLLNHIQNTHYSGSRMLFAGAIPSEMTVAHGEQVPDALFTMQTKSTIELPALDNAPGGYRQDLVKLRRLITDAVATTVPTRLNDLITNGANVANTARQCFMSNMSVFDLRDLNFQKLPLNNQNLFLNIDFAKANDNVKSPFMDYFSPTLSNLKHVEVNLEMIDWIQGRSRYPINQLTTNESYRPDFSVGLRTRYNVQVRQRFIGSVNVLNGGNLQVNGSGNAGFGTESPTANSTGFIAYLGKICGRDAIVTAQSGGQIGIGEGNRTATLVVQSGSSVHIYSSGSLNIGAASQIIIENGGKLELEADADLQINGKIVVKRGGELIINGTFQFSGSGYFEFDEGHIFTQNAPFVLGGATETKKSCNSMSMHKSSLRNR